MSRTWAPFFSTRFRRHRAGFALYSALAVVLLFAFAVAFAFMIIHEGDRKVERFKGERATLNLAESATAAMIRRFEKTGAIGSIDTVTLDGGTAGGEMKLVEEGKYQIRAEGAKPLPGGVSSRTVIIVEGTGLPGVSFTQTRWRFARGDER